MIRIVKTVKLNRDDLSILTNAIIHFSLELTLPLLKEQFYSAYICQQLYKKLRTRENRMLDTGKQKTNMTFDSIQALAIVEVLTHYPASVPLNALLFELGAIVPIIKKVHNK